MAPNRGIVAHFAASKASISRHNPSSRSAKAEALKDATASTTKPTSASQVAPDSVPSSSPSSRSTTPKRRQMRTRLRTPEEGEVDRMIAENQQGLLSSPSRFACSAGRPMSEKDEAPTTLLGTPPATPRAGRSSPLLEPTHMSPISVRTEPDTRKMFLMLPKSPIKPTSTPNASSSSSPSKRKMATPPNNTSPTKTPRTLDATPRRLITGETEMFGTEEEDGLVLTPGRSKGTRIALGSPSKSPLLAKLGDTKDNALRGIVDQDAEEEGNYITPRMVRERAKGLHLPPMATEKAAAVFRGANIPSSSSAPSLLPANKERSEAAAGPSHSEIEETVTTEEVILPELKHTLGPELPLPSFYSSLMSLHVALEHALVVHLATAGCSSAALQSSADASDSDSDHQGSLTSERKKTRLVRLPNLISYSALRPLVERSGGRRLGPTELRRLASVWTDFHQKSAFDDASEEQENVRGLGFIITKTRSMDPRTGRRALDWGIGIELEIKRTIRESTPPPSVGFGGVQAQSSPVLPSSSSGVEGFDESVRGTPKMPTRFTTPPPSSSPRLNLKSPMHASPKRRVVKATSPSPSSPKARSSMGAVKAREGMSVVAMWNNGLEVRKAEVGRRLRERCGRYHQLWLDEKGISVPPSPTKIQQGMEPATPSKHRSQIGLGIAAGSDAEDDDFPPPPKEVVMGAGGLLTPSATRSGGRRAGKRTFHVDPAELDACTLSEEDEDEQDLTPGKAVREQGKKSLIDEVLRTELRSSKSLPSLRSSSVAVVGAVPAEGQELNAWHVDFPVDDPKVVRPVPLAKLPSLTAPLATPHRNKEKSLIGLGINETPKKPIKFTSSTAISGLAPSTPTSVSTAGMTLRERIAAKEQLRRTASLPSLANAASASSAQSDLTPMQALSQRAMVSRLPELSSILFMLFSNGTTLSSTGITRSPTIPMQDLLNKLSKSVKIQLSPRECRSAIEMLGKIAPGFLTVLNPSDGGTAVGKEYVRLGRNEETGTLWRLNEVRARIAGELNAK